MNEDILIEHGCIADTIISVHAPIKLYHNPISLTWPNPTSSIKTSLLNLHISPYLHFFKNKIQELEILSKLSLFELDSIAALSGIPLLGCCSIWHKRYKWSKSFFPLCTDFRIMQDVWVRSSFHKIGNFEFHDFMKELMTPKYFEEYLFPQEIPSNLLWLWLFE